MKSVTGFTKISEHNLRYGRKLQAPLIVLVDSSPARTFDSRIRSTMEASRIVGLVEGLAGC